MHETTNKEEARLLALQSLQILDTPIEERFERITRLAARTFDVPMCAISCIDHNRQWFKSIQGVNLCQTARDISFCQRTIESDGIFEIQDARIDPRFCDNPLVIGDLGLVFYAGVPIQSFDCQPIATFCIIDTKPRELSDNDRLILLDFARLAQYELHSASPNCVQDSLIHQIGESWRRSLIDPLTRLWNLDGARTIMDELLRRVAQSKTCMSAVMIDLTDYKQINSEIGHPAADDLLRTISKNLLIELGDDCIASRIGSDQFLLLFDTHPSVNSFSKKVDRIQAYIDQYQITVINDRSTLGGAISAVLVDGQSGCPASDIFESLDEGMYNAKLFHESQIAILGNPPMTNGSALAA